MLSSSDQETNAIECRICHSKTTRDLILSPCLCKGSMAYVHFLCLERWLNISSRDSCELCYYQFNVVLNRRYTCLQSIRIWTRHPTNRAFIQCDLAIGFLLTVLTLGVVFLCVVCLNRFDDEEINTFWSEGIIDICIIVLLIGYLVTIYSMAKDHIRPWYTWWIQCNNVKLVVEKKTDFTLPQAVEYLQPCKQKPPSIHNSVEDDNVLCQHKQNKDEYIEEIEMLSINGFQFSKEFRSNRPAGVHSKNVFDHLKPRTVQGTARTQSYLESSV